MITRIKLILAVFLLSSCSGLNKLSLYNLSGQYDNTLFTEIPSTYFNTQDEEATVFVSVFMNDLVVGHDEQLARDYRKAILSYQLFDNYESKQILASDSILMLDSNLTVIDTIMEIRVQYPGRGKYILKLELTDLNRVDVVREFLVLDNSQPSGSGDFLIKNELDEILFSNALGRNEPFFFQLADSLAERVFVRYYNRDFPLALPPFLEETETNFDYNADSVFIIGVRDRRTDEIDLQKEGFYHFQTDTNSRGGFTVFRFADGFPNVVTTDQMLQPLRYITTASEFSEMEEAIDVKLAIDNFWLSISGNPARARAMIQKYYGRVVDANRYFTSYIEGWKTDRGIIYIVYGPPRIVYRGKGVEEWLYGEKGNKNSIRLRFVKVINPFTENDYSLIKSPAYKEKWYNMVNNWRR
jgi:GWxTD domain-containing protein